MSALDLSVVIIAKDEERDLPACLQSVRGLAAEVVVLDGGSGDRTADLARAAGARVERREFDTFAAQKQAALDRATRTWVLSLDADERVTPELGEELRRLLGSLAATGLPAAVGGVSVRGGAPLADGFELPFQVEFMGRVLRYGGPGSERHLRLFRRTAGRFVGGGLHEGVAVEGRVERLRGAILHLPYRDLDEYLEKLGRYTTLAALKRLERGCRANALHHLLPFWELFVRLVLRLGILDGTPGIVYGGLAAFHTWVKYVKLRQLQEGR